MIAKRLKKIWVLLWRLIVDSKMRTSGLKTSAGLGWDEKIDLTSIFDVEIAVKCRPRLYKQTIVSDCM